MARLTDHFIISLYKLMFEKDPPCMFREEMDVIVDFVVGMPHQVAPSLKCLEERGLRMSYQGMPLKN